MITGSYNPDRNFIKEHLKVISNNIEKTLSKYENVFVIAEITNSQLKTFYYVRGKQQPFVEKRIKKS